MLYQFLQAWVLMGLIVRCIMYISFQKRLSLIGGTLARLMPELWHFVIIVFIVCTMLAAMLHMCFGYRCGGAGDGGRLPYLLPAL